MPSAVDQALLVLAAGSLAAAALRMASLSAPGGLERVVAAAPIGVAIAVIEALLLGSVRLSGSPLALAGAAVATLIVAYVALPAPAIAIAVEARVAVKRPAVLAVLGAAAAFVAWQLYRPFLGYDGLTYHLSTVVAWVQSGRTGGIEHLIAALPVGNYPLTNEASLAWLVGISHGFAPVAFWTAGLVALFAGSAWLGLRALAVEPALRIAAIVALCATPIALRELIQADSDFAALAWLAATAGLAAAAQQRPRLLVPAVLAAGLAVGSKTTVAALILIVLVLAAVPLRRERALRGPLLVALLAALGAGGIWYLRNLFEHGSPFWPLVAFPGGDPVPPVIAKAGHSLLERPAASFHHGVLAVYREGLAGALLIVIGALSAPLWAGRTRAVMIGAGATLVAVLAWASAPFTGFPYARELSGVAFDPLRYALPAIAAGAATVALAGRISSRAALIAACVFAAATGWSVERYLAHPYLLSDWLLWLGLATLALACAALAPPLARVPPFAVAAILAAGAGAGLAVGGHGYLERHAQSGELDAPLVTNLTGMPVWRHTGVPIAANPIVLGTVAGDRLTHRLSLIGEHESCARIAGRVRRGYVILGPMPRDSYPPQPAARCLARTRPALVEGPYRVYGGATR